MSTVNIVTTISLTMQNCGASTAHTSAANLSTVFGGDMSPILHGLQDVSECAHSEPNSPPKAGEGTSDGEMSIDKDEGSSKKDLHAIRQRFVRAE